MSGSYLRWQLEKGATLGLINVLALMIVGLIIIALSPVFLVYFIARYIERRRNAKPE